MTKKIISFIVAFVVSISCSVSLISSAVTDNSYFIFVSATFDYTAKLNPEANFSSMPNVELPSTYNGDNGELPVVFGSAGISGNTTIKSISIPANIASVSPMAFQGLNALEEIRYTTTGQLTFSAITFMNCSSTLNGIYISASSVNFTGMGNRAFTNFFTTCTNAKIYVPTEAVKQQIVEGTKSGVAVPEEKIEVKSELGSTLPKPEVTVDCEDITYGTEGGFKPTATVKVSGEIKSDAQPKFELYKESNFTTKLNINSSLLGAGTYYIKAYVDATEEYQYGEAEPKEVHVNRVADANELQSAVEEGETYTSQEDVYTAYSLQALKDAVTAGQELLAESPTAWAATKEQVDEATQKIKDAIKKLVKTAELASPEEQANFISALNKYRGYQSSDYTQDSWEQSGFKSILDEMIAMESHYTELSSSQITDIISRIDEAAGKLEKQVNFEAEFAELEAAAGNAEKIVNDAGSADKYTAETLEALKTALKAGKDLLADKESVTVRATILNATSAINNAIAGLVTFEQQDAYDALQKVIEEANTYNDADAYTKDSYKAFTDALGALYDSQNRPLINPTSQLEDINEATEKLQNAIEGLKKVEGYMQAGEPFAYVYKDGKSASVASGTYDGTAAATQIRFRFDCASDANFGPNASIEVEAYVDESQIGYDKPKGIDATGKDGSKNARAVLTLDTPLEVGQDYEIKAFTYANQNASDYVYGITKVEFLDAEGNILKTITDVTLAKDDLKALVESAKTLDAKKDNYTADSYAKLLEAITEAEKEITNTNATKNDVDAAKTALQEAIKGLKEKSGSSQKPPAKQPIKTAPTTRSNDAVKKDKKAAQKVMKAAKITKLKVNSKTKKKINVTWKKVRNAKGYQVQVSTSSKFKSNKIIFKQFTKKKTLKISNRKIKSKKTYYVRVRAYTTYKDKNGKPQKVYSKWNKKLRKVKVK